LIDGECGRSCRQEEEANAMPFALPADKSVQFGPEGLLDQPALAARVTQIASAWNLVDQALAQTYGHLVAERARGEAGGGGAILQLPDVETFVTLEPFVRKQDLLHALLRDVAPPKAADLVTLFEQGVAPRLRAAKAARDAVLQGVWGNCIDYPDALVLKPISGQSAVYRESDFRDDLETVADAAEALSYLRSRLYDCFV